MQAIVTTLILTQGKLAEELLAAARKIVGNGSHLAALSLDWDDGFETARDKLASAVEQLPAEGGLLILTDIWGGTPTNVALTLRAPGKIEVVSGVNLPMVVRLGCLDDRSQMSVEELAEWIRTKAQASICCGDGRRATSNGGA